MRSGRLRRRICSCCGLAVDESPASVAGSCVGEDGELLSQGEIVEDECASRQCQGANGPEGQLEKEKHSGRMRTHVGDGKRIESGGRGFGEAQVAFDPRGEWLYACDAENRRILRARVGGSGL